MSMFRIHATAILFMILFCANLSLGQDCVEEYTPAAVEIGHLDMALGGPHHLKDDLLYWFNSYELVVIDMSDPGNPELVSTTAFEGQPYGINPEAMATWDHWLLIATYEDGIYPVDISDPTLPVVHKPFLRGDRLKHLAVHGNGIFTSSNDRQLLWLDAGSLPMPHLILETDLAEMTRGEVTETGRCCFGSGPHGLYLVAPQGHFFKLYPILTGAQPAFAWDHREEDVDDTSTGGFSIVAEDSTVWYTFGDHYSYHVGHMRTLQVDAQNIQVELLDQRVGEADPTVNLLHDQVISGSRVYHLGPDNELQMVRSFSRYLPPFIKVQDKLVCINNFEGYRMVVLDYSDFDETYAVGSEFVQPYTEELEQWGGYGCDVTLRPPYIFFRYHLSGNNWSTHWTHVLQIEDDGSISSLPLPAGLDPVGITDHYLWGYNDDGMEWVYHRDTATHADPYAFPTPYRQLFNDRYTCSIFSPYDTIRFGDLSTPPPVATTTLETDGRYIYPTELFKDRYLFVGEATQEGISLVVLDLEREPGDLEVQRVTGFWNPSTPPSGCLLNGDTVTIRSSTHEVIFHVADPTNPQIIPLVNYPGRVREDISVIIENTFAHVYLVSSPDEYRYVGQILVDPPTSTPEWDIYGQYLVMNREDGAFSYALPCDSHVPTQLRFFELQEDAGHLVWSFLEDLPLSEMRIQAQLGTTRRDLVCRRQGNRTFSAEVPADLMNQTSEAVLFHLLVRQDDQTWVTMDTVEKTTGNSLPGLEILAVSPNPFNPTTTISYHIPRAQNIKVEVFDLQGQRVRTLVDGHQAAGPHSVTWSGRSQDGRPCASGSYFLTVRGESILRQQKMTLLK